MGVAHIDPSIMVAVDTEQPKTSATRRCRTRSGSWYHSLSGVTPDVHIGRESGAAELGSELM
jgi:hypothetical protein